MKEYLTLQEAAAVLRVSLRSMYRYISHGDIEAVRVKGVWRVPWKSIDPALVMEQCRAAQRKEAAGMKDAWRLEGNVVAVVDGRLRPVGRVVVSDTGLSFAMDEPDLQARVNEAMKQKWPAREPVPVEESGEGTVAQRVTEAYPRGLATLPHAKTMLDSLGLCLGDTDWVRV